MRIHFLVATIVTLLSLCEVAQAEIFASGPVYGGQSGPIGGGISCRIFNYGLSTVSISQRQIFTNTNIAVALTSDTCNVALAPNRYCAFTASIAGNLAYSCRLVASGTDPKLSGAAEVSSPSSVILNTLPIQK
jgi:hypothetical protein